MKSVVHRKLNHTLNTLNPLYTLEAERELTRQENIPLKAARYLVVLCLHLHFVCEMTVFLLIECKAILAVTVGML